MRKCASATVAFVVLLNLPRIAKADLSYSIQNYPTDQNGANLTGTITTDGVIGTLAASDILVPVMDR